MVRYLSRISRRLKQLWERTALCEHIFLVVDPVDKYPRCYDCGENFPNKRMAPTVSGVYQYVMEL